MDLYFDMLLSRMSQFSWLFFHGLVFQELLFVYFFGLLDMVVHNWIIETCIYPFCSELKSGSPDCFAIADTTYTNGERLQI